MATGGEFNYNINLKAEGLGPTGFRESRCWPGPAKCIALFERRGCIFDAISGEWGVILHFWPCISVEGVAFVTLFHAKGCDFRHLSKPHAPTQFLTQGVHFRQHFEVRGRIFSMSVCLLYA